MSNFTARFPIGVVNANGHLYTRGCMEKALAAVRPKIEERQFFVHPYPQFPEPTSPRSLFSVVGIVTSAEVGDNEVALEIEPLPGRGLVEGADFRMAGVGTVGEDGMIQDDYRWDHVLVCPKGKGA